MLDIIVNWPGKEHERVKRVVVCCSMFGRSKSENFRHTRGYFGLQVASFSDKSKFMWIYCRARKENAVESVMSAVTWEIESQNLEVRTKNIIKYSSDCRFPY